MISGLISAYMTAALAMSPSHDASRRAEIDAISRGLSNGASLTDQLPALRRLADADGDSGDQAAVRGGALFVAGDAYERPSSSGLTGVCAADLDGDGDLDLAAIVSSIASVVVLLNDGAGRILSAETYAHPCTSAEFIAAGDLNSDGHTDLAITCGLDTQRQILINDGFGRFGEVVEGRTAIGGSRSAVVADVNDDSVNDLILGGGGANGSGNPPCSVLVLLGQSDGSLQVSREVLLHLAPVNGLAAGDVDRDGFVDLVFPHRTGYSVTQFAVMRGNGAGDFAPLEHYPGAASAWTTKLVDLNGDQWLDIAASNFSVAGSLAVVCMNTGTGTFGPPTRYDSSIGGISLTPGDFDLDGDVDLAACDTFRSSVAILLNDGQGTFTNELRVPVGMTPIGVESGDFDNDGDLDLAVSGAPPDNRGRLRLFMNQTLVRSANAGDLNCDGLISVADIRPFVLTLTDPDAYAATYPECDINAADLNGDGFVTVADIGGFVSMVTAP